MTNKEMILECLIQDDEAFTQIVEYFEIAPAVNISHSEIRRTLEEMVEEGYIFVNHEWKTEKDEYPFSLTDKGKAAWRKIRISWDNFLERYLKHGEEFLLKYNGVEYHLAFHNEGKKSIAEFKFGTPATGYVNLEYPSAEVLLEKVKIDGKSIQEIWDHLIVE